MANESNLRYGGTLGALDQHGLRRANEESGYSYIKESELPRKGQTLDSNEASTETNRALVEIQITVT